MYEIGRICIKLAGRDAGREAVIVDVLDDKYVLIDGNVRRRKCNIMHLEPTSKTIKIKKKASYEEVKREFKKLKLGTWETKPRKVGERPRKQRGKKKKAEEEPKAEKKKAKKQDRKAIKEAKVAEEKRPEKKKTDIEKETKPTEKKE